MPKLADQFYNDSTGVGDYGDIDPKRFQPALTILISHTKARRAPRLTPVSVRAKQRRFENLEEGKS
jgi:hypothetical protein